jgi:hypothetical protein
MSEYVAGLDQADKVGVLRLVEKVCVGLADGSAPEPVGLVEVLERVAPGRSCCARRRNAA